MNDDSVRVSTAFTGYCAVGGWCDPQQMVCSGKHELGVLVGINEKTVAPQAPAC